MQRDHLKAIAYPFLGSSSWPTYVEEIEMKKMGLLVFAAKKARLQLKAGIHFVGDENRNTVVNCFVIKTRSIAISSKSQPQQKRGQELLFLLLRFSPKTAPFSINQQQGPYFCGAEKAAVKNPLFFLCRVDT